MPSPTAPSLPPPDRLQLEVRGAVPAWLDGRVLGIGHDGAVHSVVLGAGRSAAYRSQRLHTNVAIRNVLAFGGTILAFADDSPAYELSAGLDTLRQVDLAGQRRALAAFPVLDPMTRDLHLVASGRGGRQSHIVVTAGALTRRERPIVHATARITELALTRDRVVFVADGVVGVTPRDGETRTTWIATGAPAPHPVLALEAGDTVVLLALTPSLERWTLDAGVATVAREVLDPTPRRFAHANEPGVDGVPRLVWTAGSEAISALGSRDQRVVQCTLRPHVPGDFAVVRDMTRPDDADGAWLVVFVHGASGRATEVRVLDAADITAPAIATVRIPRAVPRGLRCVWIPSISH